MKNDSGIVLIKLILMIFLIIIVVVLTILIINRDNTENTVSNNVENEVSLDNEISNEVVSEEEHLIKKIDTYYHEKVSQVDKYEGFSNYNEEKVYDLCENFTYIVRGSSGYVLLKYNLKSQEDIEKDKLNNNIETKTIFKDGTYEYVNTGVKFEDYKKILTQYMVEELADEFTINTEGVVSDYIEENGYLYMDPYEFSSIEGYKLPEIVGVYQLPNGMFEIISNSHIDLPDASKYYDIDTIGIIEDEEGNYKVDYSSYLN